MTGHRIDTIMTSVLERKLNSITREMGLTLLMTTRSPVFNEARDFVTAIFDEKGRLLSQTEYIPLLAFAIPLSIKGLMKFFADRIYPGDVFIHNDVYTGGNQSQDIAIFSPVFYKDDLIFWTVTKGHHVDVGGSVLGGYNVAAREVWQEALRIPPLKICEEGRLREDVWNLILANTRLPHIVGGDLKAQIGGCSIGKRGLSNLVDLYGMDVLRDHIEALLDSTERRMRSEIEKIPDGIYTGEGAIDHDGLSKDKSYRVRVKVTVRDSDIVIDYTGTDDQAPTFVNAPYAATASVTMLALLMCIDPCVPHNEGIFRPVKIIIPEGSILNARFPAPTAWGNFTCNNTIPDAIFKALAPALTERVTAGWQRPCGGPISGIDPRNKRVYADTTFLSAKGGGGATYGADGWSHIGLIGCAGGLRTQDYEIHEVQDPHFLIKHEYWTDSAGAGRWRGGLGVHTIFKTYAINPTMNLHGDGLKEENTPFGLFGGKCGPVNKNYFIFPDGQKVEVDTKQIYLLSTETILETFAAGGGGYGDPFLRDPEKVREDVLNGFISLSKAEEDYGVVIDPETLEIDYEATIILRGRGVNNGLAVS